MADNTERIDKFLHDQMSLEESEAFLNDLRADKELRDEAQAMAMLIKEMREEQSRQDAEIIEDVLASNRKARIIRLMKWAGSIAAMLIIFLGGNQIYTSYRINKVFDEYYEPYESHLSKGPDDEAIQKELADLYNKIGREKNVTPIISRLQDIYDNIQSGNDDYMEYSYYENDIAWYLALAYIKEHKTDKAKELLVILEENSSIETENIIQDINKFD